MSTVSVSLEVADLLRAGANVIPIDSMRCHNRHVATWDGPQAPEDLVPCSDDECEYSHDDFPEPVWVALQQPCPTCKGTGWVGDDQETWHCPERCGGSHADVSGRLWFTITTPCDGRCDRTSGAFKHSDECSGEWPVVEASIEHIVPVIGAGWSHNIQQNWNGYVRVMPSGSAWHHFPDARDEWIAVQVPGVFVPGGFAVVLNTRPISTPTSKENL